MATPITLQNALAMAAGAVAVFISTTRACDDSTERSLTILRTEVRGEDRRHDQADGALSDRIERLERWQDRGVK